MAASASRPLLGSSPEACLDPMRYWVLLVFFILTANQCLFWFTFSSDPSAVEAFYPRVTTGVIDQLLNWGPISFVPAVPFVSWLLTRADGIRFAMRLAAGLCFAACAIRLIPSFLTAKDKEHWSSTLPLHIAQIFNGIAGPVLIAAPSRLSAVWFPPGQRATVTAIANSSLFGAAIAFYLGPGVIDGNASNITKLLLVCLGMSIVPLVAVWIKMPIAPRWRVPGAITEKQDENKEGGIGKVSGKEFFTEAARLVVNEPALALLMLTTALGVGVYDAWIGILPQLLTANVTQHHHNGNVSIAVEVVDDYAWGPDDQSAHYKTSHEGGSIGMLYNGNNNGSGTAPWAPKLAGLCGMAHTFACIAGMWVIGPIADKFFRRKLKLLLILLFVIAAVLFGWVISMFENDYLPWTPIPRTVPVVFTAVIMLGFFRSATVPILYEFAAEICYPHPEGTSAGLIVMAEHTTLLTLLFIAPHVHLGVLNLTCFFSLALCPLVLAFVRPKYGRSDQEQRQQEKSSSLN